MRSDGPPCDRVAGVADTGATGARGKKVMLNAASKVVVVVEKMLLPLLDIPVGSHVVFGAVDEQTEFDLFDELRRKQPDVMDDVDTFARHATELYQRYQCYAGSVAGSSRVVPVNQRALEGQGCL